MTILFISHIGKNKKIMWKIQEDHDMKFNFTIRVEKAKFDKCDGYA